MRKLTTNAVAMLLALVGCMGCGNRSASSVDNLIRVDVMADYPEKELILQDLMDVEYIALETTDDFITKGAVKAIGKDIMLVTNRGSDGEILVFDKNGKGLRKINRLGQSGEEYTQLTGGRPRICFPSWKSSVGYACQYGDSCRVRTGTFG